MSNTFVTPVVTKLANAYKGWFACVQRSFSLAPLGGMSSQSGNETVYSRWVQMPCEASALDLALAITGLAGTLPSVAVTVQTCRQVVNGSAVDTPRAAMGGSFGTQNAPGTVYAQCIVLQWVRLQIVVSGLTPSSAFSVTGTGVPLGVGS
jgi:hypothetical protein